MIAKSETNRGADISVQMLTAGEQLDPVNCPFGRSASGNGVTNRSVSRKCLAGLSIVMAMSAQASAGPSETLKLKILTTACAETVAIPESTASDLGDVRPAENIEVDVSTRSIAVTSTFTGIEIVAFGAVERSRQTSAEAGYYDVVIVFSGTDSTATVRRKSKVAGIWVNTNAMKFTGVPSYYAIASSRVLNEITDEKTLQAHRIGAQYLNVNPLPSKAQMPLVATSDDYKTALINLKKRNGLFVTNDFGVTFVGRSLFRATIKLPANVPVGPLIATTYLFHNGEFLSSHATHMTLERQGSERFIYGFAFSYPLFYGVASVVVAVIAGIAASALFQRRER